MASSAVCRGSRLVYGSWNTICTSPPRRRRSRADRAGRDRSAPQAMIVPLVGRSSPTIIRAMVVLPEPDSPTIAIDRPAGDGEARRRPRQRGCRTPCAGGRRPARARSSQARSASGTGASGIRHRQLSTQLSCPDTTRQAAVESGQVRYASPARIARVRAARREGALARPVPRRLTEAGRGWLAAGWPPAQYRAAPPRGPRCKGVAGHRAAALNCGPRRPGRRTSRRSGHRLPRPALDHG